MVMDRLRASAPCRAARRYSVRSTSIGSSFAALAYGYPSFAATACPAQRSVASSFGRRLVIGPEDGWIARCSDEDVLTVARALSLAAVLARRRSVRSYGPRALTSDELSRLLWAAQGITDPSTGGRTAPSAGAIHPLEIYAVTPQGTFRYVPESRELLRVFAGDRRGALARELLPARVRADHRRELVGDAHVERRAALPEYDVPCARGVLPA